MSQAKWLFLWLFLGLLAGGFTARGQIDPERRRLLHLGYNQPLQGRGPIAAYGFYYYNQPNFFQSNLTLRAAIAPIYLDSELGIKDALGPNTDLGVGLAGGGFADSYSEIRDGVYRRDESFTGHGGAISSSVYHLFNAGAMIPLWGVLRGGIHHVIWARDDQTASNFALPEDRTTLDLRTGFRYGGQEPNLNAPLAMELSGWYEGQFRLNSGAYGYNGDRATEVSSHLYWARGLIRYTFPKSQQVLDVSLTLGGSTHSDRFSAYRLGGALPFLSEFPLNIPGYYYQEITAERFALLNAQYSIPLNPSKSWRWTMFGATGPVDYLPGLEQAGHWHSGLGAGITYKSPSGAWLISLLYGHGFDAIRSHGRGADSVGLVLQYRFHRQVALDNSRGQPLRLTRLGTTFPLSSVFVTGFGRAEIIEKQ